MTDDRPGLAGPPVDFEGIRDLDNAAGHPAPTLDEVEDDHPDRAEVYVPPMPLADAEIFATLARFTAEQGGTLVLDKVGDPDDPEPWMCSVIFGAEAPDSDMAAGQAIQAGATREAVLRAVADELGVTP